MITSLTSPKIARVRRLLDTHSPREREELGAYVVEGLRAVRTALDHSGASLEEIFIVEKWSSEFPSATVISDEVARRVSETVSSQGIFAVIALPAQLRLDELTGDIAIFVELQDPGNAGTVIRSAHAFGFKTVALSKGSVDPYSAKVVRASVGSLTATSLLTGATWDEILSALRETHQILAFDVEGTNIRSLTPSRPVAMIFGNEARGLPDELLADSGVTRVSIPMSGDVESLNVASAATVAMYEISQRPSM